MHKYGIGRFGSPMRERLTYFVLLFGDLKIPIFDVKCLFFLSQCYYEFSGFNDI